MYLKTNSKDMINSILNNMRILTMVASLILLISSYTSLAQPNVGDTVTDFTVTDVHKQKHNLYQYLDKGKYVCIDFFGTTCYQCYTLVPTFNIIFGEYGSNKLDLVFLALNCLDDDATVLNFEQKYGGKYPAVSGMAGGKKVFDNWEIQFWPQLMLIKPDHTLAANIDPINYNTIDSVFRTYGLSKDTTWNSFHEIHNSGIKVFPNPVSYFLTVLQPKNTAFEEQNYVIQDCLGKKVASGKLLTESTIDFSLLNKGVYFLTLFNGNQNSSFRIVKH